LKKTFINSGFIYALDIYTCNLKLFGRLFMTKQLPNDGFPPTIRV
jgi:hypothetical protein